MKHFIRILNENADIIQIIIGILSLLATVAVSFAIYWLQKRHEKEVERIEEKRRQKEIEDEAHRFLIDHEGERDYLPLCVVASNLTRHEKHTRTIYTDFCRCSEEVQAAILKTAGFTVTPFQGTSWVDTSLSLLREDIKKYQLGKDYLYDGAKYFHRAFTYYRDMYTKELPAVFDPINKFKQFNNICFTTGQLTIADYIDEYFYHYIGKSDCCIAKPIPPIDYVWDSLLLSERDEETVCMWMLELVNDITVIIHNRYRTYENEDFLMQNQTDAEIETFEDKYYDTLLWMYYTYYDWYARTTKNNKAKKKK